MSLNTETLVTWQETQLQTPLRFLQELLLLVTQLYQALERGKSKQSYLHFCHDVCVTLSHSRQWAIIPVHGIVSLYLILKHQWGCAQEQEFSPNILPGKSHTPPCVHVVDPPVAIRKDPWKVILAAWVGQEMDSGPRARIRRVHTPFPSEPSLRSPLQHPPVNSNFL